jgi:hypothetical protein
VLDFKELVERCVGVAEDVVASWSDIQKIPMIQKDALEINALNLYADDVVETAAQRFRFERRIDFDHHQRVVIVL